MNNKFQTFFKIISYAVVLCGLFSLYASESIGIILLTIFLSIFVVAWFLENSDWQFSERVGTGLILLLIPIFYIDWKYGLSGFASKESLAAGSLGRSILILSSVKLLQKKSNRDWIFLYVISFFEILLAAGLSISPLFVVSLTLYLICAIGAIIAFEIKKTSEHIQNKTNLSLTEKHLKSPVWRLLFTSLAFLLITSVFAVPLFFALPRTGNPGFGKSINSLTSTGFSESVKLGDIANVQQNDEVVMRIKIDDEDKGKISQIRWRGIALDKFDNLKWSVSRRNVEPFTKTEQNFFRLGFAQNANNIVVQTIYLEPLETGVIFSLARPIAVQGNFPLLNKDNEGSLNASRNMSERATYKVFSDTTAPSVEKLRNDNSIYPLDSQRYLQLPEIDKRISQLAQKIIADSKALNRYDQAKAIESYLKNNYGYTLDLKAGGDQPLADFLFNVREGHCEYFATALAIMLRTQGIAARVVNGFQAGEYNETADVYVVRQREAHSWVEVYFPGENAWIPFDATPAAGQFSGTENQGIFGGINKYAEALEMFWIQYVVSYDNQEQKSLVRSLRGGFQDLQSNTASQADSLQKNLLEWWKQVRGDQGLMESGKAIGFGLLYILAFIAGMIFLIWLYRKIFRSKPWQRFSDWLRNKKQNSIVEFYERMQKDLESKGFTRESHQTPLEFAFALKMPEAISITEKYNRVRFGEKNLSNEESAEIENWLNNLQENTKK